MSEQYKDLNNSDSEQSIIRFNKLVPKKIKSKFVKQAQLEGKKLVDWMLEQCEKSVKNQSP